MAWGVLGGASVTVGDEPLTLGRQGRYVLGCLLRRPGQAVPPDRLVRSSARGTTERAVAAGRVAVSRLRAVLARATLDAHLSTTPAGYVLDVDPLSVDHIAFEQRIREAEATEWPDAARRSVEAALSLWRGEPFGEWRDDPAFEADARALEELYRNAVDLWGELALRSGDHRHALTRLEAAVTEEPLRERRWASLVLAHYRAGNQSEALRVFERARTALREQVGLEPGPELQRLVAAILQQDPALDWEPQLQRARPTTQRSLTRSSVVIGREDEINDVLSLLERHRVVTITGFGGVGKSSLAGEVASRSERPAWVVPLASTQDPGRVPRAVAESLGVSAQYGDPELTPSIAERLQAGRGLLVLDNCEHVLEGVRRFVSDLVTSAPAARVLATSRAELDVPGAAAFTLGPLAAGTRSAPGPAALIAADFAMIRPSAMADQWELVASICRQADGVPLALELLGSAAAQGEPPTGPLRGVMEMAVETALRSLSAESREIVEVLAVLPATMSVAFLAELLGRDRPAIRRAVGYAARAGLVVHTAGGGTGRVRLLEPARDIVVAAGIPRGGVEREVHRTVMSLARRCHPSLLDAFDEAVAGVLDDEHHIVMWLLDRLGDPERLELACALSPLWGACGRTAEGRGWLERLGPTAMQASPLQQARYWIVCALISPSLAGRVPLVDQLRTAVEVADRHGDLELAARARGELAVGLMWSGDFIVAEAVLAEAEHLLPTPRWAELTLAKVRAISQSLGGEPLRGAAELVALATEFLAVGSMGDVMSSLFIAAVGARLAGDTEWVREILTESERYEPDRFSRYSHAALTFERAQLAVRDGSPEAGPRLWEALGRLTEHGEHRTAEVCRRELGQWRLAHGDPRGAADLARAARMLAAQDSNAAAVALAHLGASAATDGHTEEAARLRAAARALLEAPGGGPLSAEERSVVGPVASPDGFAPTPAELDQLLRRIESRTIHA